jgi:Tfp pilus assembly protein PilF
VKPEPTLAPEPSTPSPAEPSAAPEGAAQAPGAAASSPEQAVTEVSPRQQADSSVSSRLAFGYLNRGKNPEAATFAARAVEADPSNSEGWIVLGAARQSLGDRKGANDAYRKCAELGRGEYVPECKKMLH